MTQLRMLSTIYTYLATTILSVFYLIFATLSRYYPTLSRSEAGADVVLAHRRVLDNSGKCMGFIVYGLKSKDSECVIWWNAHTVQGIHI